MVLPRNMSYKNCTKTFSLWLKMLESRPEDALVKLVKTVEIVETACTAHFARTAHPACTDHFHRQIFIISID